MDTDGVFRGYSRPFRAKPLPAQYVAPLQLLMTQSVSEVDEAINELCDLMDQDLPVSAVAEQAMDIGISLFGVENGHLTSTIAETDHWEIIASTDPSDGKFSVGRTINLQTTFCRHVLQKEDVLALHDVQNQGWGDDIAFETHELGCYLGTPITVDGDQYGTLCFVDESARSEPFSKEEQQFVELLSQMVACRIESQHREFAYAARNKLVDVFSRILRHNLRNNMTVVRGQVMNLFDQLENPPTDQEEIIEPIDELVALTEKARELESVIRTEFGMEEVSVVMLLRNSIEELEDQYPSTTFSLEAQGDAMVVTMPTIETAFHELLENAAKHSGENSDCSIAVETKPEQVTITIADNGPGLSEQEQRVFQSVDETPLTHGSGVGLWMADWIVRSHDGTVDTIDTENGTRITLSIPRPLSGDGMATGG